MVARALARIALAAVIAAPAMPAHAQLDRTSDALREANAAATAGDWLRTAELVAPLLTLPLAPVDRAEAHRLAGIAAFFQQHPGAAEAHFLAYLRIDLDGRLDPALYPPDVVAFFNDVASRHAAELRALRTRPRRTWLLNLIPPAGQLQNGERGKAYAIGGMLGTLLVANLTTYLALRAWCDHTDGSGGGGLTCDDGGAGGDRTRIAEKIRPYNIGSGIGFLAVYAFGVYDGWKGYRQRSREQRIRTVFTVSAEGGLLGVAGSF